MFFTSCESRFSLLECEIRIAEHRRQSTKEDVGVEARCFSLGSSGELQKSRQLMGGDKPAIASCSLPNLMAFEPHRFSYPYLSALAQEPFLLRSRKINVFEHEAKRKLALARIHHRLKLTREAGLEVPRLEVLLQKTKLHS